MRGAKLSFLTLLIGALVPCASLASPPLRSDLPLWPRPSADVLPQIMATGGEIGVESEVGVGDWRIVDSQCEYGPSECETWLRVSFIGATDVGFVFTEAATRAGLETAPHEFGFIVILPTAKTTDGSKLFAFEIGMRGGSRYLLVRGNPPFKLFDVLSVACDKNPPAGVVRRRSKDQEGPLTDYCVALSRNGLVRLAHVAASYKAEARMSLVDASPP
jgi:hypothetical protein